MEREVLPVFRASNSPKLSDAEVRSAVGLLFELLELKLDDPSLDGVGQQTYDCLIKYLIGGEYAKLAALFEPFGKFLLKLIRPTQYDSMTAEERRRFLLPGVLETFGLASKKEIAAWNACPWLEFPPADLPGLRDFKEQVGWTYKRRNAEEHLGLEQDRIREATVFRSVCVCFVWLVAKFAREIRPALLRVRFGEYLRRMRDDERRAALSAKAVELTVRPRSAEEYRVANPLLPVENLPVAEEEIGVFKLPEANRVTVIEGEAGAGKTTALEVIAWREADRLLDGPERAGTEHTARLPVLVRLKACHTDIAARVQADLGLGHCSPPEVPWDSLLLLVDGLNEVSAEVRSRFQAELQRLLELHPGLRLVITGRLNSVRGEYPAAIVQLQPLSGERLGDLISKVAPDAERARIINSAIFRSPGLRALARTPFYAATLASLAATEDLARLTSRAAVVQACVQRFLRREEAQASANVHRTKLAKKELLLAHLAFETKAAGTNALPESRARKIIEDSKERLAPGLDVLDFIEELVDNHMLERLPDDAVAFAHDIYQDYFAASKLNEDESLMERAGVRQVLDRFANPGWEDCIRLFAELAGRSQVLIEEGAELNPALAWLLIEDAGIEDVHLREVVADSAYCALTSDLADPRKAAVAKACLPVLAALERVDLLVDGIKKQRRVLEPEGLSKLPDDERNRAEREIQTAILPLGYGLITVLQLGVIEQKAGKPGKFFEAGRHSIVALKEIGAARVLVAILGTWSGKSFSPASLVPGLLLDSLIDLGVDAVLDHQEESHNQVLDRWLERASEANHTRAWPAYGRVLRLVACDTYMTGITCDLRKALHWLQKAHDAGDQTGSRELALLLIEEPGLAETVGEGEQRLRRLAEKDIESRYELGVRLLKGCDLPQAQPEGLENLLSAAEAGHARARFELSQWFSEWCFRELKTNGTLPLALPVWAKPLAGRLKHFIPVFQATDS